MSQNQNPWPVSRLVAWMLLLIFLGAFCWWVQWEPYKRKHREITPAEKIRVQMAIERHGNYLIECEGDSWVMLSPKGRIRL